MNKYEIIGIVGEGAYGIVYKAKNKETGMFGKWNSKIYLFLILVQRFCICLYKNSKYYLNNFSKKWFKFKLEEFEENIVKKMLYFRMTAKFCTF